MNRNQLQHVLRAVSRIIPDDDVLVIGSQSILGTFHEKQLPETVTGSIEVNIASLNDPDEQKSDLVDGAIGEMSQFHHTFGYYAQSVSVSTAVLPVGWRDRTVTETSPSHDSERVFFLEPHDCVVAKLVACREKDFVFAEALVDADIIDLDTLACRVDTLDVDPRIVHRVKGWIQAQRERRA